MRASYDRVPSDTRRPLIPDLPIDELLARRGRRQLDEDTSRASLAIAAVFGLMLLVAIGLGMHSAGPRSTTHVELSPLERTH